MEPQAQEFAAVMSRLEKLEKQNSRFKQVGALALIFLGSVLLMGQAAARRTVEANEFVLKDDRGQVRGRFHLQDGGAELVLFDPHGTRRVWLAQRFEKGYSIGPEIGIADEQGNPRTRLQITNEITPELSFEEKQKVLTTLSQDSLSFWSGGQVEMFDKGDAAIGIGLNSEPRTPILPRVRTPVNKNLQGDLERLREQAKRKYPGALVQLLGPKGSLILRTDNDLGSAVILTDKEGSATTIGTEDLTSPRTGETHKTSAASVVLFDKDKKVLWKAP